MRIRKFQKYILLAALCALTAFVIAGCGGDSSTETGAGAPDGATGKEAGGFAVEAGKQRSKEDIENEKKNYGPEPPPIQLDSGDRSDYVVSSSVVRIVNSKKELNALVRRMGIPDSDIAPVDFKTRQVVLVQMSKQPAGTMMQIKQVTAKSGTIEVVAVKLTRGQSCKATGGRTNPYHFVETRKMTERSTKLRFETTKSSPCS